MDNKLKKALDAAYDVCIETKFFVGNVLASDQKEDQAKSDQQLYKKATKYINWYDKTFKK